MTTTPEPDEIPVYEDPDVRDLHYHRAESAGEPYLAVERVAEGSAVTFDLLPAGVQLTPPARESVRERFVAQVEAVVGDAESPETEISHTLGAALGSAAAFEDAGTARRVAAALGEIVLEESNWERHVPPDSGADPRTND
jgi:hypothetical protein